jgi:tetratricopeptide (TPR) repeat protein
VAAGIRRISAGLLLGSFLFLGCCRPAWIWSRPDPETARRADSLHTEGIVLMEEQKLHEAIEVWSREILLDPVRPKPYNNIGMAYRKLGMRDMAIQYHEKSIAVDPSFGHAYYSLGLVYYDRQDYRNAKAQFHKAIENNYADADVYYSLGQACKNLKQYKEALSAYEEAAKRYFRYPGVHYQIALIQALQGNADLARMELKREVSLNSPYRIPAMIQLLKDDAEKSPDKAHLYFELGGLYAGMPDDENALDAYNKVLALDPKFPEAHFRRGQIYFRQGKFREAEQEYEKELETDPGNTSAQEELKRLRAK